jgi:hypothetical protein
VRTYSFRLNRKSPPSAHPLSVLLLWSYPSPPHTFGRAFSLCKAVLIG